MIEMVHRPLALGAAQAGRGPRPPTELDREWLPTFRDPAVGDVSVVGCDRQLTLAQAQTQTYDFHRG